MPSQLPRQGNRLGYALPMMPVAGGARAGVPFNPLNSGRGAPQTPYALLPVLGAPNITPGYPAYQPKYSRPEITPFQRVGALALGKQPRVNPVTGRGVEASVPQVYATQYAYPSYNRALPFMAGTPNANVVNPLFGRPGFQYMASRPQTKLGPIPKLSWPSGGSANGPRYGTENRALGFQPASMAAAQAAPMNQFDYQPAQDPTFDVGTGPAQPFSHLPYSIHVGDDGATLLGTYRAHDFTPAAHFFKQGRSAAAWQDQSFGPDYRYLVERQQVARYNLYTQVALARQLSPNAYFLNYQTQPAIAAQLSANGMGAPLGYGAH